MYMNICLHAYRHVLCARTRAHIHEYANACMPTASLIMPQAPHHDGFPVCMLKTQLDAWVDGAKNAPQSCGPGQLLVALEYVLHFKAILHLRGTCMREHARIHMLS
jgi:hypothetical protein